MCSRYVSGILLRRYTSNFTSETIRNVHFFPQNSNRVHGRFKWCSRRMSMWLRDQSIQVVRACMRQFEFIAAQRVRRSVQIFHLYTRIWDEVALREFIKSWRRRVARSTKDFLVGAVGVTVYNWEHERIADNEMYSYCQEIQDIRKLRDSTVVCSTCKLRLVIDTKQSGVEYCQCHKAKRAIYKAQEEGAEWQPFIERRDMLIWRKEEKGFGGLYAYKVYGNFNDVSAEDFLQVQIDIDYRKEWDATAKQLEIIDTDPSCNSSKDSCSDVIYWEMVWPRMFANRDYVYQRRWLYDKENEMVIIVSKGTHHPNAPDRPDTYRVTTYWSYMVIKPYKDYHKQGIEFVLTYFDDPGVNIPSAVTAWVAMSGLPDYLCRMRQAGKDYQNYKELHKPDESAISKPIIFMNTESDIDSELNEKKDSETDSKIISDITSDTKLSEQSMDQDPKQIETSEDNNERDKEEDNSETDQTLNEDRGFLDYFFLAKLFA